MIGKDGAREVEWAGVALRMSDGTVMLMQLDHPTGSIDHSADAVDILGYGYADPVRTAYGASRLRIELEGYVGTWRTEDGVPPAGELPGRPAIEGGTS